MDIDYQLLTQTFLGEASEFLQEMEQTVLALEDDPAAREPVQTLFRLFHTVKGDAWSLGFEGLVELAHSVEDLLAELCQHTAPVPPECTGLLLQGVDLLRVMLGRLGEGFAPEAGEGEALKKRIARALENLKTIPDTPSLESFPPPPAPRKGENGVPILGSQTVRVSSEKLDRLLNLITEITLARESLSRCLEAGSREAVTEVLESSEGLQKELQNLVMDIRMVPIGSLFSQFRRTIRDLALANGKEAVLVVEGGNIEVDMTVFERIRDPLSHLVRNSIHHGIEPPPVRTAQGKGREGVVSLKARNEGGWMVVEVCDDGAGLQQELLIKRALEMGLAESREDWPDKEVWNLIFQPGFSTATGINEFSGRGVGMDVVKKNVESLRGTVEVESFPRRGVTVRLQLPLTLAIIDGMGVTAGGEQYIIPCSSVVECLALGGESRQRAEKQGFLTWQDRPLPCLFLDKWFGISLPRSSKVNVVVVEHAGFHAGIVVENLLGIHQAVIKPLGRLLQSQPFFSGSSVLEEGKVAFILDIPKLLEGAKTQGKGTIGWMASGVQMPGIKEHTHEV